jgi:hypothetical protein
VVGPLGVVGALASIVAVPLAVIFWLWPVTPKRDLTYAIQPVRTSIVQVNQASDIAVTYKGKPINGDLSAAQIMIANAGKEPIEQSDIISPIAFAISNASIVEFSVSVPPKTGTDLTVTATLGSNRVALAWKILERGDNPVM